MSTRTPGRISITFRGGAAVLALAALLVLPYLVARSLEPAEAEARIREHMTAQVTARLLAEPERPRLATDLELARRWEAELARTRGLRFRSIEIRRALLVPPFRRRTSFAVRAVVADRRGAERTRYFWFFGTGPSSVAETTRLQWQVPL